MTNFRTMRVFENGTIHQESRWSWVFGNRMSKYHEILHGCHTHEHIAFHKNSDFFKKFYYFFLLLLVSGCIRYYEPFEISDIFTLYILKISSRRESNPGRWNAT